MANTETPKVRVENMTGTRLILCDKTNATMRIFQPMHPEARLIAEQPGVSGMFGLPIVPCAVATGITDLPEGVEGERMVYIVSEKVGEWARVNMLLHHAAFMGPDYSWGSAVFNPSMAVIGFKRFIVYKA